MKVVVVGAGLAGLAAACELADLGHQVTVLERRQWAGGKAYSTADGEGGWRDNGQHVFMRCTTAYTGFLRKLGTLGLTFRQQRLSVPVFDGDGRESRLVAADAPPPLHLAASFARYRHLTLSEKREAAGLLLRIWRGGPRLRESLRGESFAAWLASHGQSPATIARFWDFLLVPTLNCRSDAADAADALFVIQRGFLESRDGSALGVARVGLSLVHGEPAVGYIEARGGEVRFRSAVRALVASPAGVTGVTVDDGFVAADAVIVAVASEALTAAVGPDFANLEPVRRAAAMPTAPIVNLHITFERAPARWPFAAFTGSDMQWAFNREALALPGTAAAHRLTVSLSDAVRYLEWSPARLREHFEPLLVRAMPGARGNAIFGWEVTKEPQATFVPAPGLVRPANQTGLPGLYLAGAYTDTGWPATMESAVRSGTRAAHLVHVRSLASGARTGGTRGG